MNLITSLIIFDILIIIYQILIEVFSILYRVNGISMDVSKFQVVSLLTGTGFTTLESEGVMLTKKRRLLTRRIMFFSYIFNITIVSTFVNIFASTATVRKEEIPIAIGLTLFIVLFLIIFYKTDIRKNIIDKIVLNSVNHRKKKKDNFAYVYDSYGNKVIAEVEIKKLKRSLKNKNIEEMGLKDKYGIQLLVIKRGDKVISEIYPDTVIEEKDIIVVFGKLKDIKNLFIKEIEKQTKLHAKL